MEESTSDFESQLEILSKIEKLKQDKISKEQLNESNSLQKVLISRNEHQNNKKSLKSDAKKTGMFVNKLRSMNSEALIQCIRDVETFNLTLYISEIVAAILEINFKPTDVSSIVKLCIALHKRYEDFTPPLIERLRQSLLSQQPINQIKENSDESQTLLKKKRIQVRLIIELFECGIFKDELFFVNLMKLLMGKPVTSNKQSSNQAQTQTKRQVDLMSISTFVKYGSESLLGLPSKSVKTLSKLSNQNINDITIARFTSPNVAKELHSLVSEIFEQVCSELVKAHKEYKKKEKKTENDRMIHGTLSDEKKSELENIKKVFDRLYGVATGLAESLGQDIPVLEEEKDEEILSLETSSKGISVWDGGSGNSVEYIGPFSDPESRSFYEDLVDLTSLVPLSSLGLTLEQAQLLRDQWKALKDSRYSTSNKETDDDETIATKVPDNINEIDNDTTFPLTEDETVNEDEISSINLESNSINADDKDSSSVADSSKLDTPNARVLLLLQDKLIDCTTRQKCDEFCINYCHLLNKSSKNKLIQSLCKIPYGRSELIANYARIVATFTRIFNDFSKNILTTIMNEIYYLIKSKVVLTLNQIDNKSKTFKYLGELIKFNVIPPIYALKVFKSFLDDFSSHNIDFMCVLLESCGRYLYMLSYTHDKMEEILELMLRARRSKLIELRLQSAIDSAYFTVKPPDRIKQKKKELTQIQRYIRYLLFIRLCDPNASVDDIIYSLRRLPYNNPAINSANEDIAQTIESSSSNNVIVNENMEYYIVKYSLKISRQKYMSISILADCLSGLLKYRPNILIRLIDTIVENVVLGLETISYKRDYQRMIGLIKLIGELYNYQVISSSFVFDLLYLLINYGHNKYDSVNDNNSSNSYTNTIYSNMISNYYDNDKKPLIKTIMNHASDMTKYDITTSCEIDPSYDLFRAQLIVELINTCGEYYMKGFLREKLNNFLIYFQKYLLYKIAIPISIEFSILDMFDQLDLHAKEANTLSFTRYSSIEEIQPLLDAIELKQKETLGIAQDENEEDGEEEERQSNDRNKSTSVEDEMNDNQGDDSEGQYSDEEDNSYSQFEASKLLDKLRVAEEEDEEFNKAFKSVMMESLEGASRSANSNKSDIDRMAIPAVLPKPKNILRPVIAPSSNLSSDSNTSSNGVVFKLLARDTKGRIETRQLCVPDGNDLVVKLQKSEEINRLEKQRIKEKVLLLESMNEDQEYEDNNDESGGNIGISSRSRSGKSGRGIILNRSQQNYSESDAQNTVQSSSNRMSYYRRQTNDEKKPIDTLNLDEFLAETKASDIRKLQESQLQQQSSSSNSNVGNRRR